MPLLFILSSAPNSGKGTVCDRLLKDTQLVHLSTGDLLRDEIRRGSETGAAVQRLMAAGRLVGEDIVNELIVKKLQSPEVRARGAVLDGFPRTESQALWLAEYCINSKFWQVDAFVVIEVPDDVLVERAAGRRLDPETNNIYHIKYKPAPPAIASRLVIRDDDKPDRQRLRISTYRENAAVVEAAFADRVVRVNGNQPMAAVYDEFCRVVAAKVWGPGSTRGPSTVPPKMKQFLQRSKL